MADTVQFDLVSPERKLASVEATMVELPGMQGDMAAMPNHSPVLTTLRPGIIRVHAGSDTTEYVVTGGFADITSDSATVLAEQAMDRAEVERSTIETMIADANASLESSSDELSKTALAQRVNDLTTLMGDLGL